MELRLLQDLQYLRFPDLPRGLFPLARGLTLTTDKASIAGVIDRHFMPALGGMLRNDVLAQDAHLVFHSRFPDIAKMTEGQAKYQSRLHLINTQLFLQALWLLKDNSGNAGPVFIAAHHDDSTRNWSHDSYSSWYFTSNCRLETTSFTHCDVRRALRLFVTIDRITPRVPYERFQSRASGVVAPSRIARALYTSQMARAISDVVVKIAHNCISLEALFSTDTAGVGHRVAERVANFIGSSAAARRSVFDEVKSLYDVRSRFVHGGHIKPNEEAELLSQSVGCDKLLRRCFRKMLGARNLLALFASDNQKQLRAYFLETLFRD